VADEELPRSGRGLTGRQRTWLIAALVGLLALAIGFGVGVFSATPRHPGDDSAEAGFARDMSTHHGQAVSMAAEEYRTTTDPELRQIGIDITVTQQSQIGMMQAWLQDWGLGPSGAAEKMSWMPEGKAALKDGLMPGIATPAEMAKLRAATGRDKDILFCQLMIRHHLGGIHMVDGLLDQAKDEQLRSLAQSMKDGQQYEINALRDKLKDLGASP
jgi:uncharacterized protein (DUF305 family)